MLNRKILGTREKRIYAAGIRTYYRRIFKMNISRVGAVYSVGNFHYEQIAKRERAFRLSTSRVDRVSGTLDLRG